MKAIISSLFVLSLVALPTASFADKKCKDGYVWDEAKGKCVVEDFRGGSRAF